MAREYDIVVFGATGVDNKKQFNSPYSDSVDIPYGFLHNAGYTGRRIAIEVIESGFQGYACRELYM